MRRAREALGNSDMIALLAYKTRLDLNLQDINTYQIARLTSRELGLDLSEIEATI